MEKQQSQASVKVGDIMIKNVISVTPDTLITQVASLMSEHRIHGIPVVEKGKVAGIITEKDFFTNDASSIYLPSYILFLKGNKLYDNLSPEKKKELDSLLNAKAKDIMNPKCVTILREMQVKDLLEFFKTTKFMTFPVTDEEDKMVGIITLSDIIGLLKP